MVQFRAKKPHEDVWQHPNDYWKLDTGIAQSPGWLRGFLTTRGYSCKTTRALNRLEHLYVRCQRGLPSYEGLLAQEIEHFLIQRGTTPASGKNIKAYQLKMQLEEVDEKATFHRSSDLPPELRQNVYDMYFASFDDSPLPINCQPPITLASRMTRGESLPLFYSRCEFALGIRQYFSEDFPPYNAHHECFFRRTKKFLQNITAQDLSRIKYFQTRFDGSDLSSLRDGIAFDFSDNARPDMMLRYEEIFWEDDDQATMAKVRLWAEGIAARVNDGPLTEKEAAPSVACIEIQHLFLRHLRR